MLAPICCSSVSGLTYPSVGALAGPVDGNECGPHLSRPVAGTPLTGRRGRGRWSSLVTLVVPWMYIADLDGPEQVGELFEGFGQVAAVGAQG